jgi:hypothetical protein
MIDNSKIGSHQACTRAAVEELNLKPGAIQIAPAVLLIMFIPQPVPAMAIPCIIYYVTHNDMVENRVTI